VNALITGAAGTDLEARLASFVRQDRLPGAVAGVVRGDELAWLAGTGFAELATGKATDPAMLYGIVGHQDVHRDGDHATAGRGPARSRRPGGGVAA
jgi:hypothetical protein